MRSSPRVQLDLAKVLRTSLVRKLLLENKKSDGVSVRQKERAWTDLCAEFNLHLEVNNRTVKQIRQYYDNLKRSAKTVSNDKLERFRTGRGVFKPSVDDTAKLVAIIQDQDQLQNPFDSNAEYNAASLTKITNLPQRWPGSQRNDQSMLFCGTAGSSETTTNFTLEKSLSTSRTSAAAGTCLPKQVSTKAWTLRDKDKSKLQAAEMRFLRFLTENDGNLSATPNAQTLLQGQVIGYIGYGLELSLGILEREKKTAVGTVGNLHARRPWRAPGLTRQHEISRWEWAEEHENWNLSRWNCVMFSDETRICLKLDSGQILNWRVPGNAARLRLAVPHYQQGGGSIMFWACIMHGRHTPLLPIKANITAAETEDICIGRHVGPILLQHLEEIKLLDEKRKKELALARKKFSYRSKDKYISPSEGSDSSASIIEDWGTQRKMESIVSSRYLGRMHQDLYFLKHLEKDPRIHDGQRGYAKTLASLMKKTLDVVTHTKTYAESLRERRKIQLLKKIVEHTSTANKLLDRTRKERESGSSKRFIECVLKVKEYLYQTPIKLLPNKQQYLDILYNITGLAYLDHLKLEAYIDKSDAFAQVEEYYGIQKDPNQPLPSRRMTHILLDYRQILANCEASLEISRSELEKVWLYYEIAKANHELGNKSEIARTAIKKSIREAKSLRNLVWNINSCVLASRIEMKSQARTEARLLLQDALDCAKKMGNESVVDFLEVCYDVVENSSNEVPADMIEVRQKRILSVMATEKQRTTVAGLFNYMDTLPTARRMSIVPGVKQNSVKRRLSKVFYSTALRLKFKKVVGFWLLEQKRNYIYYFNYKNIIVRLVYFTICRFGISDYRLQRCIADRISDFRFLSSGFIFMISDIGLQTSDLRLQTSDFRFYTPDFRLEISDFIFQISDFQFPISDSILDFRLQISDFRFPISDFRFQTSDFRLQISDI
ncbi:hypothetical protein C0J52_15439 [Blattella germanica]|nr:hypothetical protein C0J52_15439 [Blattella germanica]